MTHLPYSCYFNHEDIPENRARKRRFKEFEVTSGLKEILSYKNAKRLALKKLIKTNTKFSLDHTTFWELGNMTVLMNEPYRSKLEDFVSDKLYVVEIPVNIAPYCGGYDDTPGAVPGTKSFLITSILKKRQLDEVFKRLIEREKELPPWNEE
jgi:hypothetical protein